MLQGKNEQYLITCVKQPFEDVEEALVIVGSDRRGTIYGTYELSEQIGVSPWYWWADVPVAKKQAESRHRAWQLYRWRTCREIPWSLL